MVFKNGNDFCNENGLFDYSAYKKEFQDSYITCLSLLSIGSTDDTMFELELLTEDDAVEEFTVE